MNLIAALPEYTGSLIILGVAAGVLSAMLGVGSGILLVPALVIVMGLPQKSAQGTALAVMVPMALVGVARYMTNPDVNISLVRVALLSAGAMAGALIGAAIASRLPGIALRRIFAAFLLVVAVRMMWSSRGSRGQDAGARESAPPAPSSSVAE